MSRNPIETITGAVVLVVAASFLAFAYKGAEVKVEDGYNIKAKFTNATGLNLGSDVRIGGIKIGVISDMMLDPETYEAITVLHVKNATKLPKDSSAAIVSSGLLGDKFVSITPGADEEMVKAGGTLQFTQSSVSLEELIGKFMFSAADKDKDKKSQ